MLTLAFDTATGVATSALVRNGEVLGERSSRAVRVLADADELLQEAGAAPDELVREPGTTCVGDGAVRYREVLEALGATVPPRESQLHIPRARFHAELAREFVDPETVEPLYLRLADAERAR